MQFLWKYIDELVGKGLELGVIGELIFYLSLTLVPLAIPISILLSAIITFGDLGEHYELVALKSAGIPLTRFMMPIFTVAVVLAGITFLFADRVLPQANLKFGTLLYSITKQRPAINIKPGVIYDEIDGFIIKIGSKDPDNITLNDVIIWDQGKNRPGQDLLVAEKGEMFSAQGDSLLIFKLYNGWKYQELSPSSPKKKDQYEQLRTHFSTYEKAVNVALFGFQRKNEKLFTNNPKTMTNSKLILELDTLQIKNNDIPKKLANRINPYFQSIIDDTLLVHEPNDSLNIAFSENKGELLELMQLSPSIKNKLITKAKDNVKNLDAQMIWAKKQYAYNAQKANIIWYYYFNKYSLALSCIILFLIGAAMGAIIRKGGLGLPMVVAIILFVVYYMLSTIGKGLTKEGVFIAFHGAFLPVYILLPFAIYLVYKASNDAVLLNLSSLKGIFSGLYKFLPKKKKLSQT